MNPYEQLAEQLLSSMDKHRHMPPEPVSGTIRGEMAVLRLLGQEHQGMSAGAIAETLHMTTSRIAAVLNSLEKKDMITRESDLQDKRRVLVCLTDKGQAYHAERRNEAKSHLGALLSRLSLQEAETYVHLTLQLLSHSHPDDSPKEV